MPNRTYPQFSGSEREFREVERLRRIIADFAEKYFGVHEELEVVQAANRELRAQNKFLVSDNARLEANLKKLEAKFKALQNTLAGYQGEFNKRAISEMFSRAGINHVDGHQITSETKRSEKEQV